MFLAQVTAYFPVEFFSIVPLELKSIQLLAQRLILIEAIFLMHICLRVIIKLITALLETALALVFIVAVYFFYSQNSKDPQATEDRLRGMLSIARNFIDLVDWILSKIKQ
jgi:predicted neutral ceramidase superfamily lipid hydrolase